MATSPICQCSTSPFPVIQCFFLKRDSARYSRSQKSRMEWSTEKLPKKLEPDSCAWHIYIIYSLSLFFYPALSLSLSLACFFRMMLWFRHARGLHSATLLPLSCLISPSRAAQEGSHNSVAMSSGVLQFQAVQTFGHKKISSQVG